MLLVVRRENFVTVFDPNPPVGQSDQEDFNRQDDQTVLIRLPVASEDRGKSEEKTVINLIKMFKAGPEVSLNGSPTVSPTTQAL